jgi:hypothetical protein
MTNPPPPHRESIEARKNDPIYRYLTEETIRRGKRVIEDVIEAPQGQALRTEMAALQPELAGT